MGVYIPLATKYRPQRFSEVIGQDVVIKIITRGIARNRLGAAILFSGTRGVGKTTIARILAKTFRCENLDINNPEPCGKCTMCLGFSESNQMDVIEIDAASNTSVDDIREIIESCKYKPTTGVFKIFIIDEVHMLSKSAFNALLKTLEEPPEHIKFLFATTETYKIPETILSRVLKFDLKHLDVGLIAQYLSSVCNQEGIIADTEALELIARIADGSIRDSLSILDQAINIADDNELTIKDVRSMLNISDDSDVFELFKIVISGNAKAAIEKYRKIISSDISSENLIGALMNFSHALSCYKIGVEVLEKNISHKVLNAIQVYAKDVSLAALSKMWQMLIKASDEIKLCENQEIVLEMIIARISYAAQLPDLADILLKHDVHEYKNNDIIANAKDVSLLDSAMSMFPGVKVE